MEIDIVWTPQGRASATRNGIAYADAITVAYARTSIGLVFSRALWMVGRSGTALITVELDRERATSVYGITAVRPATANEARAWRSKQP